MSFQVFSIDFNLCRVKCNFLLFVKHIVKSIVFAITFYVIPKIIYFAVT